MAASSSIASSPASCDMRALADASELTYRTIETPSSERDEDLPQRRSEDAIGDQARANVRQLRLELRPGQSGIGLCHRRAAKIRHHVLEHAVALQLVPALAAD